MPKTLYLTLTYHWWEEIADGRKTCEYRRFTEGWRKRLNRLNPGDVIVFHRGYTNRTLTRQIDVVECPRLTRKPNHPAEKPVALLEYLLKAAAKNTVLDVFMGSGTTLVACERLGLKGTGIEINEKYFDVACRRVEEARCGS